MKLISYFILILMLMVSTLEAAVGGAFGAVIGRGFGLDALIFILPSLATIMVVAARIDNMAKVYEILIYIASLSLWVLFFWYTFTEINLIFEYIMFGAGIPLATVIVFYIWNAIKTKQYTKEELQEIRRQKIATIKRKKASKVTESESREKRLLDLKERKKNLYLKASKLKQELEAEASQNNKQNLPNKLRDLKSLLDEGILTQEEYDIHKNKLLEQGF